MMIQLKDFNIICRLCLTKDEHLEDLFSTLTITENKEENDALLLAEMVESFCRIKVRKGDGLPEHVCKSCLNSISSLYELRSVSVKSNRLLSDIMNSHNFYDVADNELERVIDLPVEFIDTEMHVKEELLTELTKTNSSLDNNDNSIEISTKIDLVDANGKVLKSKKKRICGKIRKVSCEMCGKLVPAHFIEFHLNLHKDIRPYKCEVEDCDKYFVAPTHAKNHYIKVHVNGVIRPYKCEICGRGFNQRSSLTTHMTYHFDPQIPCSICGQFYRNKRAIKKHLLVHSGERKYSCSECQKSFQTNSTLRVHMRTHTLEKPYSCSECSKAFAYKCLLKGHIEKIHPK